MYVCRENVNRSVSSIHFSPKKGIRKRKKIWPFNFPGESSGLTCCSCLPQNHLFHLFFFFFWSLGWDRSFVSTYLGTYIQVILPVLIMPWRSYSIHYVFLLVRTHMLYAYVHITLYPRFSSSPAPISKKPKQQTRTYVRTYSRYVNPVWTGPTTASKYIYLHSPVFLLYLAQDKTSQVQV